MRDTNVLTSFLSGARSSLKLWLTDRKPDLRKNMNYDPKIPSLCRTQTHSQTHSHKHSFPFVSSYCFFWSTVKTVNHEKKDKIKEWNKRHASGRVRLTVAGQYYSFSSQWLVTDCLCYTPKNCQGDKHQSSTRPRPLTRHFPFVSWLFIFYPVKPVLHYYQHFSYCTLIEWHHLAVVVRWCTSCVVVLYTAWWGQSDTAEGGILPPAGGGQDCYIYSERLTGGARGEGWR